MKRRYKVLGTITVLAVLAIGLLAVVLSHDSPCGVVAPLAANTPSMKAIVYRCYGSADVLKFEDIAKPIAADDRVLVKVHAASVNPLDWHYMQGKPYVMRPMAGVGKPDSILMGADFAGTVESVGKNVKRYKPGDEVFGDRDGAFGEYVSVREHGAMALKPANMSMEQAAAVPVAGVTALQALRDKGKIQAGQKVLINGASGGVGTFAVQIAKTYGADVTGVCSTRNVAMVKSIGADHVIDYTQEDFTQGSVRYDLIIDNVGNHTLSEYRHVLTPKGALVMVGGPSDNRWLGPLTTSVKAYFVAPFVSQKLIFMLAQANTEDLNVLRDLMQTGKLTPVIDRRYPLSETAQAISYLEQGHAKGKVIITVDQ
ncbi:MAG TPA: NAD(P)-dependent alcohol dehydrogenase [Steroidobacteraceae bacterium]|jgi:NADPH:quinone reductase-like Zn-dependent oxidoreductase|nr:NAD(P)-dependent alcohol dehydrogenase [Steroidobacteraceae bacterium]